jgi:hypothetical protein
MMRIKYCVPGISRRVDKKWFNAIIIAIVRIGEYYYAFKANPLDVYFQSIRASQRRGGHRKSLEARGPRGGDIEPKRFSLYESHSRKSGQPRIYGGHKTFSLSLGLFIR